ncbi:hypothetical protein GCM10023340_07140 [Nocardioides marinquilinus]|uniref:Asp23/Gls24 family envelope stress response protein n=1 Tax=Nocardioides marinquilinus TaxID=1210400 RepID=A0ABP9P9T8_9ACTN
MAVEPTDPLVRATIAAREAPVPPEWPRVAAAIRERVRGVIVPAAPVLARTAPDGALTFVSTRVVVAVLRARLTGPDFVVSGLDLDVDRARLLAARVTVVVRFGVVLDEVADAVRATTEATLAELLPDADPAPVAVHVADVVEGDPRR